VASLQEHVSLVQTRHSFYAGLSRLALIPR
jgi:hypothetical protein